MTTLQIRPDVEAEQVVERVRDLVPLFRANAQRAEDERRVPQENIEALTEAGVYRLSLPVARGGMEASIRLQNEVLALIARGCASTSWVTTIGLATNWIVGLFPDQAQDEIYATPNLRTAGVIAPTGKGRRQPDGSVVLNGRWAFNTGCEHAQWGMFAHLLTEQDGSVRPHVAMVPYAELEIHDEWHAMGLSGTGSQTTTATNVSVPAHRLLSIAGLASGDYVDNTLAATNPYFGRPGIPVLLSTCIGTPQGIAHGAWEVFLERLPGRRITYTNYASQIDAPITHHQVAHADLTLFSMDAHAEKVADLIDGRLGIGLDLMSRAAVRGHSGQVTRLAKEVVDGLFVASGASAIQTSVAIQRHYRDISSLALHAFLQYTTTDELYGRVLLGLDPDSTFL